MSLSKIKELLGAQADSLLNHQCKTIDKSQLHQPGGDFVDRMFIPGNRNNNVLRNLQSIYDHGRLSGTGYVSILPVDQGIEHSAGASFAPNPQFFDPENIVKLAIDAMSMTRGYQLIVFISIGIILLVVSFMYQKFKPLLFGEEEQTNLQTEATPEQS